MPETGHFLILEATLLRSRPIVRGAAAGCFASAYFWPAELCREFTKLKSEVIPGASVQVPRTRFDLGQSETSALVVLIYH